MVEMTNPKRYDLENRILTFAKSVREFLRQMPVRGLFIDDSRQLVRSSGSIGANYIEANESLSKKDFAMRIKICRKEAKETAYWLDLLDAPTDKGGQKQRLTQEARELMAIFGSIVSKI